MAEEQAVGVREQSDPSAAATPEAEAQNDALAAPTPAAADDDVAADEA